MGQPNLTHETKLSDMNGDDRGNYIFSVQLITIRIGNHTCLTPNLLKVMIPPPSNRSCNNNTVIGLFTRPLPRDKGATFAGDFLFSVQLLPSLLNHLSNHLQMLAKFYRETMEASVESTPEPAFSEPVDNEEDVLVNDPDVARLLAEMRENFNGECDTGPESETGEEGGTGGKDVNGVRQEDKINTVGQENSPREDEATSTERRQRNHDENGLQQAGSSCGIDGNGWRNIGHCKERGGQKDGGTAHLGHTEISTATEAASATQSQQGSIDISRIKIDGLGSVGRSEHRSCSVPSICLSAGGCSRLSRTSTMSSHSLARAASQKLLEATKEAAEQASTDRKNGAVETPHRAASSAITKADEKLNVVRKHAEALQVFSPNQACTVECTCVSTMRE